MTDPTTGRDGTAVVVGASMAGLLAARVLAEHVGRVVVLDRDTLPEVYEQLQAARGRVDQPADVEEFTRRKFLSNAVASLRAMTVHLLEAPDLVEAAQRSGLPVWVGRGADDDAWAFDVQDEMAGRYGTQVHVVPDSAHSPAIENPEGLAEAWLPFLADH